MVSPAIDIPKDELAAFCRKHHIRKLSLFGSVLRDDFGPDSDIDVLVEFNPDHIPGLAIVRMADELSGILGGQRVDLRTSAELSRYFRNEVTTAAEVQYAGE